MCSTRVADGKDVESSRDISMTDSTTHVKRKLSGVMDTRRVATLLLRTICVSLVPAARSPTDVCIGRDRVRPRPT